MRSGPALAAALHATTLEVTRAAARYDAVVIGAGAAGGLAASLLTEAGLRVLVLDAGLPLSPLRTLARRLSHHTARRLLGSAGPKVIEGLLRSPFTRDIIARRQPIQSRCYAWPLAPWEFVDDIDCPYVTPPDRPFLWLRARQLGGRMVVPGHGRQYYRLGPNEFYPTDGLSPHWPLQPGELDPWYAAVERRLGLAGGRDNLPWLPDSELSIVLEPTPAEALLQASISRRWPGARPVIARFAPPLDALEAAAQTGRLSIRAGAIVREIEVDSSGCVRGVVWIDQKNRTEERVRAPLIFLCASALESTRLLLLSRPPSSPRGLGAASGVLGRGLMDHVRLRAAGSGPPQLPGPAPAEGRCLYLPRFDARDLSVPGPGRGFGVQMFHQSQSTKRSHFIAVSFAEMLPKPENQVTLDPKRRDAWGIPVLNIDCSHGHAELIRARDQISALRELAQAAGVTLTHIDAAPAPPGGANHECGTARMGSDPATSVLDPYNECWEARGLYVTDGACFPSQGSQNPTLTILALTARACDHATRIRQCK
jgi:choline dehydrogenase-like flavoprotein